MCKLLLIHNGRPNSPSITQKHEMIRKCPMSDRYFRSGTYKSVRVHTHTHTLTHSYTHNIKNNIQCTCTYYMYMYKKLPKSRHHWDSERNADENMKSPEDTLWWLDRGSHDSVVYIHIHSCYSNSSRVLICWEFLTFSNIVYIHLIV